MIDAAIAAGISFATIALGWLLHVRVIGWIPEDVPLLNRKRHTHAIPLAGLIPALGTVGLLIAHELPWLAAACGVATAIGFVDDRGKEDGDGIEWRPKLFALWVAASLATVEVILPHDLELWQGALVFVAIFVTCNATNFLDNMNGVSTALGVTALAWIGGPLGLVLAGVWLAFLPFNWPRGRLFLGDSGALALGVTIAGLSFVDATRADSVDFLAALAPLAVLLVDFVQVVTARLILGFRPWIGDRRHLTHIVHNLGLPTWLVAPLFAAAASGVVAWQRLS